MVGSYDAVFHTIRGLNGGRGLAYGAEWTHKAIINIEGGKIKRPIKLETDIRVCHKSTDVLAVTLDIWDDEVFRKNNIHGEYWTNEKYCRIYNHYGELIIESFDNEQPDIKIAFL